MKFVIFSIAVLTSVFAPAFAIPLYQSHDTTVQFSASLTGGYFHDQALEMSGGLESQPAKLTSVITTFDLTHKNIKLHIEPVLLSDQPVFDGVGDNVNAGYDVNTGTAISYLGGMPLREAWLEYDITPHQRLVFGRQYSFYGMGGELGLLYATRLDAPEQYFIDSGLMTGLRYTLLGKYVQSDIGVLGGRGRPVTDFEYNAGVPSGPNNKNNTTPALQARVMAGTKAFRVYSGLQVNKVGSAPGRKYKGSGEHNDNRLVAGFLAHADFGPVTLNGWAQYTHYEVGLREEGSQGRHTPELSENIDREGWVVALRLSAAQYYITLTHGVLDNDGAFYGYLRYYADKHPAEADRLHAFMKDNAQTKTSIVKVGKHFANGLDVSLFWRHQSDVLLTYDPAHLDMIPANKSGFLIQYHFK